MMSAIIGPLDGSSARNKAKHDTQQTKSTFNARSSVELRMVKRWYHSLRTQLLSMQFDNTSTQSAAIPAKQNTDGFGTGTGTIVPSSVIKCRGRETDGMASHS